MPVAQPEHGDPQLENDGVDAIGVPGVYRRRSPGEDEARRPPLADLGHRDIPGNDLGMDVCLSDPTCDQLGVLGPEVEHQH